MADVRLRIVGECIIEVGEHEVHPDAPNLFALLLYVCGEAGRIVLRSELAELLFPSEQHEATALHSVRQLLYRLSNLGAPLIRYKHGVVADAARIINSIHILTSSTFAARWARPEHSYAILPGYRPPNTPGMVDWVDKVRDRGHSALRRELCNDLHKARTRADWQLVERIARHFLEIDPLNESATLGLAEAVARTGSKHVAISILRNFERELGGTATSLALPAQLLRKRLLSTAPPVGKQERLPLPLVGRPGEMEQLRRVWDRARKGQFELLYVTGEKSIGKTRLVEEFAAVVQMENSGRVIVSSQSCDDARRPASLFADLTRQLIVLPGAAACSPDSLRFLGRLAATAVDVIPTDTEHDQALYADGAVRSAICDAMANVSTEAPLLCLVDNAEFLDPASERLLAEVQRAMPSARILFILCKTRYARTRPGRTPTPITELRLSPLDDANARTLLEALIVRDTLDLSPEAAAWCLAIASGNPGHLELVGKQAARGWDAETIPPDLITCADESILALSREAQYALQAIAIIGDGVSPSQVAAVVGLSPHSLLTALHELDECCLAVRRQSGLCCRSALFRERVLLWTSPAVASLMHSRAAALLEAQSVHPLSQALLWRIAAHYREAREHDQARAFLRKCWHHAIDIGQPMLAAQNIRSELEACDRPQERAALLDELILALQAAGEHGAVVAAAEERVLLADQIPASRKRSAALSFDGIEGRALNSDQSRKYAPALLEHLQSEALDDRRRIRAARLLMMLADGAADSSLGHEIYISSRKLAPQDQVSLVLLQQVALIYHSVFGDRRQALSLTATLNEATRSGQRSWHLLMSRLNCSLARQLVDSHSVDYDNLEVGYAECVDASMSSIALRFAARIAMLLIDDGDMEEAKTWLQKAERLAKDGNSDRSSLDYYSSQVDLGLVSGDSRRAKSFLRKMQLSAPLYGSERVHFDLLMYQMRVDQVCKGAPVNRRRLECLLSWHERSRTFGRHDSHVEVLWVALHQDGRAAAAAELLGNYLAKFRRESRKCHHLLRLRTATDPAWL